MINSFKVCALLCVCITSFFYQEVNAQEYTVKYETEMIIDDDSEEAKAMMQSSQSTASLYIKGDLVSFQNEIQGGAASVKTIIDTQKKEALVLMSTSKKTAQRVDSTYEKQFTTEGSDLVFHDETKEILGKTCKKASFKGEDGSKTVYWCMEADIPSVGLMGFLDSRVPGLILEIEHDYNEMKLVISAISIDTKVENLDEVFDFAVPEGFTLVSK